MIEIPRTPGLEEPTYDEIVSREVVYPNELFLDLKFDEHAGIFGDERPEFLKNMALLSPKKIGNYLEDVRRKYFMI